MKNSVAMIQWMQSCSLEELWLYMYFNFPDGKHPPRRGREAASVEWSLSTSEIRNFWTMEKMKITFWVFQGSDAVWSKSRGMEGKMYIVVDLHASWENNKNLLLYIHIHMDDCTTYLRLRWNSYTEEKKKCTHTPQGLLRPLSTCHFSHSLQSNTTQPPLNYGDVDYSGRGK